jgi:hypothetical protein
MHGLPGPDQKANARFLAEHGFEAVVTGADPASVEAGREAGLAVYACGGAYGKGNFPDDFLSIDVNGNRQIWFGSSCPNRQEVREANIEWFAREAETDGLSGLFIDGCRFASPASGLEAFFTCFCPVCEEKGERLGFDFGRMKQDVTALYRMIGGREGEKGKRKTSWHRIVTIPTLLLHFLINHPGILDWLRFREVCTTEHLRNVRAAIKEVRPDMTFAIYLFTPSLSPLVGQNYALLADGVIDLFAPMIYRNYPPPDGPACLNRELYDISGWFEEDHLEILETIGQFFRLSLTTREELDRGLPTEVVQTETARARALIGEESLLAPIIYLDDPEIEASIAATFAGGADGASFFVYDEKWKPFIERAGRAIR